MHRRKILVSLLGTSPAVLTETIWGFAHHAQPWIPSEIVVITTQRGWEVANERLLKKDSSGFSVWKKMVETLAKAVPQLKEDQSALVLGEASFKRLSDGKNNYAEDLRTVEDNLAAADTMLKILKGYMTDKDTEVYVSIAGGRKTMGALLFSCVSLLAREQDKIFHVLVNTPYETNLHPPFYYPTKTKHKAADGQSYSGLKAKIQLFEVPFVRMNRFYEKDFAETASYKRLVAAINSCRLELDINTQTCRLNGENVKLSANNFLALYYYLLGEPSREAVAKHLVALKTSLRNVPVPLSLLDKFKNSERLVREADASDDCTKIFNEIRSKFKKNISDCLVLALLPKNNALPQLDQIEVVWQPLDIKYHPFFKKYNIPIPPKK